MIERVESVYTKSGEDADLKKILKVLKKYTTDCTNSSNSKSFYDKIFCSISFMNFARRFFNNIKEKDLRDKDKKYEIITKIAVDPNASGKRALSDKIDDEENKKSYLFRIYKAPSRIVMILNSINKFKASRNKAKLREKCLLLSKVGTKNSPERYRLIVTLLSDEEKWGKFCEVAKQKERYFNSHQAKKLEEIYEDLETLSKQ